MGMISFDMGLCLLYELDPLTKPACPMVFSLAYSPTLLTLLRFGNPQHAMAFHRARPVHARSASRARVLHVPRPSQRVAPLACPHCRTTPCTSLLTASCQAAPRHAPAGQELAAAAARQPLLMSAPPSPPRLPPASWSSACSFASMSPSARHCTPTGQL